MLVFYLHLVEFCKVNLSDIMKSRLLNFLLPAILLLAGCAENQMDSSQIIQWISAYSPELVDSDSKIRIEPTDRLRELIDSQTPLDGVFRFSPKVKGTACLANDGRFIDFCPEQGELKEGQEYECTVNMARLSGIDTLSNFTFSFRVIRKEARMSDLEVRIDPRNTEKAVASYPTSVLPQRESAPPRVLQHAHPKDYRNESNLYKVAHLLK